MCNEDLQGACHQGTEVAGLIHSTSAELSMPRDASQVGTRATQLGFTPAASSSCRDVSSLSG